MDMHGHTAGSDKMGDSNPGLARSKAHVLYHIIKQTLCALCHLKKVCGLLLARQGEIKLSLCVSVERMSGGSLTESTEECRDPTEERK